MKIASFFYCILFLASTCNNTDNKSQQHTDNSAAETSEQVQNETKPAIATVPKELDTYSRAYFASGCFWCVEAIYESLNGVKEVYSGYAGGNTKNPTYETVGSKKDGHAETVEIFYDPEIISFETLVDVYYGSQDPTTIGQQPDYGTAYRSIIFYQNDEEKEIAEQAKKSIAKDYDKPVVTEILPFEKFWMGEEYHQDYEKKHPNHPYIKSVSIPRLKRMQAKFPNLLKNNH